MAIIIISNKDIIIFDFGDLTL